jgi:hypothetical protein
MEYFEIKEEDKSKELTDKIKYKKAKKIYKELLYSKK